MSLSIRIFFALFIVSYLFYHFFTLDLNPIPWIDEVFFASISKSVMESGKFIPEVSREMWNSKEVYIYGPIHFLLESSSFKIFGFGIVQYRWITLLCGLLTVLTTFLIVRLYHPSNKLLLLGCALFLIDPFLNLSMHEGRMDLVAIFFMLISIFALLKALKEDKLSLFIISGLFAVVSLLTTPRIGIVFVAAMIVFLSSLEGSSLKDAMKKLGFWSLPIVVLYSAWTYYAFGGPLQLIDYYQNLRETNGEYLGGRWYIPKHEYFLIALTILSVIYGIATKKKEYFNAVVYISLLSIVLFYLVVLDWGPYSAIILPFYYFLFFHGFGQVQWSFKNLPVYPVVLLFLFNTGYFALKSAQIIAEKDKRSPAVADRFIKEHIPQGSRVVGDAQFYYSVLRAGSDYRCYDDFQSLEERDRMLCEEFDYEYLIISKRSIEKDPAIVKYFLKQATLKQIAVLETPSSEASKRINKLGVVSAAEKNGYDAAIFVRIRNERNPLALGK